MKPLKLIDSVSVWCGKISSFLLVAAVAVVITEVISRYAFGRSLFWVFDMVWFLCCVVYLLGGAYTLYFKGHINVDFVYVRLRPRTRAILDAVTFPFFLAFCALMLWQGAIGTADSFRVLETTASPWGGPIYLIKLMIPIGAFLILLQGLAKFIRDVNMGIRGEQK